MISAGDGDDADSAVRRNRIDEVCDDFERQSRAGQRPSIEEALKNVGEADRRELLVQLVLLDIDLRQVAGEVVSVFDYSEICRDYPEALESISSELQQLEETVTIRGTSPAPTATISSVPPDLPRFVCESILGEGAFGIVWKAFDRDLERYVALKIPHADRLDGATIAILLADAQSAASLQHSHIVAVYDVANGKNGGQAYIVSALINGTNLREWKLGRQLSPAEAAQIVSTIARALHYAHLHDVVHRDLKPANILMDATGIPHLTDFGLAKREAVDLFSEDGQIVGTIPYMAPEQARGEQSNVNSRSDIYALGVVFYELLTGRRPFEGASLLKQVADTSVAAPAPRTFQPGIPLDLQDICLKCLEKDPERRYQTAASVADDIDRYFCDLPLKGSDETAARLCRKWFRRNRRSLIWATGSTVVTAAFVALIWWSLLPTSPRRWVHIKTSPPGCEITAVQLDPVTGEPDPARIEHATGTTPLKMQLMPGDYLIVAVLDQDRFHEVLRHVPSDTEGQRNGTRHLRWRLDDRGMIDWTDEQGEDAIAIPPADVTDGMVLVRGSASWMVPKSLQGAGSSNRCLVPDFYVDVSDRAPELQADDSQAELHSSRFGASNHFLEETGKRLPSILELAYAHSLAVAANQTDQEGANLLIEGIPIRGLAEEPWEWSLTKDPGVAASTDAEASLEQAYRITTCGSPLTRVGDYSRTGQVSVPFRASAEWKNAPDIGVRGVRSASPRRRPEDFVQRLGDP